MAAFFGALSRLLGYLLRRRRGLKIGIYGPPNGGKTTLANRICTDWLGEGAILGKVTAIPHETREIALKNDIVAEHEGKKLRFTLVDTPGIATKIDYEDFVAAGLPAREAKKRAKEATKGVIDSIKWLDNVDVVIVVLDATKDPYSQVNITLVGNLAARELPVVIAANKIDLKRSRPKRIAAAFPQYPIVPISAKHGTGIDNFYKQLFKVAR